MKGEESMIHLKKLMIVACLISLFLGCKTPAPDRVFYFSNNGYSDGSTYYELLSEGWMFDSKTKTCIGTIDDMRMNALDKEQWFIQPEKHWYEDVDYTIAKRSDVVIPDVMDEDIEIFLYRTQNGFQANLKLSPQACEEFRTLYQVQDDLIPKSLQSTIWTESKPIGTIWFFYPMIEGLRYGDQTNVFYFHSSLYMLDSTKHKSVEIPQDTVLYHEIVEWL